MSTVQSIERAFAVLKALAGGPAGVPHISERVSLPKSTVSRMLSTLEERNGLCVDDFLFGSGSWEYMRETHLAGDDTASFVDYFWTLRLMHGPIFQLARIAVNAPIKRPFSSFNSASRRVVRPRSARISSALRTGASSARRPVIP